MTKLIFFLALLCGVRADGQEEELNFQLSNAIRENRHNDAVELSKQLLELVSDDSSIWFNMATSYQQLSKYEEAQAAFDKVIELDPTDADAYNEAGQMMMMNGKYMDAIPYYQALTKMEPENAYAFYSLGNSLHYSGHDNDSVVAHKRAIELNPHFYEAYNNIATSFITMREFGESITYLHGALELVPTSATSIMNVLFVHRKVADWRWYQQHLKWFSNIFDIETAKGNKLLDPWMASTFKLSGKQLRDLAELLARQINDIVHGFRYPRPPFTPIPEGDFLRVGYVSSTGFQGNYTTAKFMRSIFGMHNHQRVQVHCFARGDDDHTPERQQIKEECSVFWEAGQWPLGRVAETVNTQQIHFLIDLSGWTIFPGTEIFAMQPAAIQLQLHGFPGTMGADYFQYTASDLTTSPPDYESHYREKIMFSPSTYLCNDFKQSRREALIPYGEIRRNESNGAVIPWPTRAEFGFEDDDIIFGAFNSLYKLDDVTMDAWLQVLARVPKAKLWFLNFDDVSPGNLKKLANETYNVHPDRLVFSDFFKREREMSIKALCDLFVDTPAFTAHTTGGDTLWAGLPMITIAGEDWSARVASGLCIASGVPETIVRTMKDYRNLMYKLSINKKRRIALRKKLLDLRENAPHFNTQQWVRDFEVQLFSAWEVAVAGLPPMHIVPQKPTYEQ